MERSIIKYPDDSQMIPVQHGSNGSFLQPVQDDLDMEDMLRPWDPDEMFVDLNEEMARLEQQVQRMHKQMGLQPMAPPPLLPPPALPPPLAAPLPSHPAMPPMLPLALPNLDQEIVSPASRAPLPSGPVVKQGRDGQRYMELKLDVRGYSAGDVQVFTEGNQLLVHGRSQAVRKDSSSDARMAQQFKRQFTMPPDTRPEYLRCRFSKDCVLTLDAPVGKDYVPTKKSRRVKFAVDCKECRD